MRRVLSRGFKGKIAMPGTRIDPRNDLTLPQSGPRSQIECRTPCPRPDGIAAALAGHNFAHSVTAFPPQPRRLSRFSLLPILALLAGALALFTPASAQDTGGICDRTEAVRDALVAAIDGVSACADVTATHLSRVTILDLRNQGLTTLQTGDFDGLTALTQLYLDGNRLTSLPDLSSNTALSNVRLSGNPLSNLSALALTDGGGDAIALEQTFDGATTSYTAKLPRNVTSVKVTPTAADTGTMPPSLAGTYPAPTIKVGPQGGTMTAVASGSASGGISLLWLILDADANAIDIEVSGRAGGPKTYTVTLALYGSKDRLIGEDGDDELRSGAGRDVLHGNAGDDVLHGQKGRDVLRGGAGNDYLHGGAGDDRLYGNEDDDELRGKQGNDELYGGKGSDVLYGGAGKDDLDGGEDDDELHGGAQGDVLHGGPGNDKLYGNEGSDELHGDRGMDELHGGAGDDALHGGKGRDELHGNAGDDTYTGGSANDRFVFSSGETGDKIITDFGDGKDRIVLKTDPEAAPWPSVADIIASVIAQGDRYFVYTLLPGLTVETDTSLKVKHFEVE